MHRRDFYTKQKVQPGEMNVAFDDVEEALQNLVRYALGWGWLWGGNLSFEQNTPPALLTISPFYGFTAAGNTVRTLSALEVDLSRVGDLLLGQGGTADGVLATPNNGQWLWYTVFVYFERKQEDLRRPTDPPVYWANLESFRVRLLAGSIKQIADEETDPPPRVDIPAGDNLLVLGDVLVKNTGDGPFIDRVDFARRSIFRVFGNIRTFLETGFPALVQKASYTPALPMDPADPTYPTGDDEGIWTFDPTFYGGDGHYPDFQGFIYWTQAGAFSIKWDYAAAPAADSHDLLRITIPILNKGGSNVEVPLGIRMATGMICQYSVLGAPFDGTEFAYQDLGVSSVNPWNPTITLIPGRNLLRLWFVRKAASRLTAGQVTDLFNREKYPTLFPDAEYLRHFLENANNSLIFREYEIPTP